MEGARYSMSFMPYGPWWRVHRKLFHDFINLSTVGDHDADQIRVVSNFLTNLHKKPDAFREHIELCVPHSSAILARLIYDDTVSRLTGSLALSIAYGIRADTPDNEFFRGYKNALGGLTEASVPGTFLIDILPFRGYNHLTAICGWQRSMMV